MDYQSKGGMCAACTHKARNCSGLNFSDMPVIERSTNATIVLCTDFKIEEEK